MGNDEQSWGMNLSIGLGDQYDCAPKKKNERKNKRVANCLNLSLPLYPNDDDNDDEIVSDHITELDKTTERFSSCNTNLEEEENAANNGFVMDKNCSRKKLRLTKEQTFMLEDCFKLHTTLNTVQKKVLAERLSLKPRQVEVWFQNRRARTKLKQTEVDCGLLKKWCENLSDENQRLKKEIQLLVEHPQSYIPLPKAKAKASLLTVCPSCHKCF